jgi:glycosyltransferase involved in cell wall biosynthesis
MSKKTLLFRGPVCTRSGYGSHSRDLLEALRNTNEYDIKIDSSLWGVTPMNALEKDNEFHNWIENNIVTSINYTPDIYIQVTVPNEFKPLGKYNIGITAGIETTISPKDWVDGCNRMDLVITTSTFSKDVLLSTVYNEANKVSGQIVRQHRIEKPISVLFEGINTDIYNNIYTNFDLDIPEDFAFLFVGHWLKGDLGQDRKDVGMLIKSFAEKYSNVISPPALILKTSTATFSIKEREDIRKRIETIVEGIINPPSIYLLFGDLTDSEMNDLYNHPKIKGMVSLTKGEGFGRPLLEFSMTGKPIIVSNWSGHKDFLSLDKSVLIGGKLTEVHSSVIDNFIIKGSKWFTANYDEFKNCLSIVQENYDQFLTRSELLRIENSEKFTLDKMKDKFQEILNQHAVAPVEKKIKLPILNKIK